MFAALAALALIPPPATKLSLRVEGDVSPDLAAVTGRLAEQFFASYPKLLERFDHPTKPAPRALRLVLRRGLRVPAQYSNATVEVSAEWVSRHPGDVALMAHELTHAVQHYPRGAPGWLTEGIADYARHLYGPKEQPEWSLPRRFRAGQSYKEGYRVAGRFLLWLDEKHPKAVDAIHRKLQDGEYSDELFRTLTGEPLDALWERCGRDLAGAK